MDFYIGIGAQSALLIALVIAFGAAIKKPPMSFFWDVVVSSISLLCAFVILTIRWLQYPAEEHIFIKAGLSIAIFVTGVSLILFKWRKIASQKKE